VYVSLKYDVEEHPLLFMNGVLIKDPRVLAVLGFYFDSFPPDLGLYDGPLGETETGLFIKDEFQSI